MANAERNAKTPQAGNFCGLISSETVFLFLIPITRKNTEAAASMAAYIMVIASMLL